MAKRNIIKIDEDKCNGCGNCIPNCPEGAIQVIDKKARLISDLFCDGLGACIGHCPQAAISIDKRDAEPYDENKVMANIIKQGENVIRAHLLHLKEHNQTAYLNQAVDFLRKKNIDIPTGWQTTGSAASHNQHEKGAFSGCPGSREIDFSSSKKAEGSENGKRISHLRQWPIQLHLVSPLASYYQGADAVLSADCVAYALGDFHKDYLKGKALAIACPKLDAGQEVYSDKIKALIEEAKINTLTVMTMEVPCCMGLLEIAKNAASETKRKLPIRHIIVKLNGEILQDKAVSI